jgi:hypothetical protein
VPRRIQQGQQRAALAVPQHHRPMQRDLRTCRQHQRAATTATPPSAAPVTAHSAMAASRPSGNGPNQRVHVGSAAWVRGFKEQACHFGVTLPCPTGAQPVHFCPKMLQGASR